MKREVLFSNEPFEVTDELRADFFEDRGYKGTDEEISEYYEEDIRDFLASMQFAKGKNGDNLKNVNVVISGTLGLRKNVRTLGKYLF